MATIVDMLRQLGNHVAPEGGNALVGPITLPAYSPSPLQLAVPSALTRGWSTTVGRPTEAHHALALAAARAGEGVALMGHGAVPHDDLLLLTLAQLLADPQTAALWLTPDRTTLRATVALLQRLKPPVTWQALDDQAQRGAAAQLTLLCYDDLHHRVLHSAERAWRWLWPRLRYIALPALHHAAGAAGGHVLWLLRRVERLVGPVQLLAALAPVAAADVSLPRLLDRSLRLIAASTGPTTSTLVALWHSGGNRAATIRHLIGGLSKHQIAFTVLGRDHAETAVLRHSLGTESSVGQSPTEARVAVVAGIPPNDDDRQRLLRAGYRLVLLLAGDTPQERLLLAQPELLGQALPAWPLPRANSLINLAELMCVASERPITEAEIAEWQVADQLRKLAEQGLLRMVTPDGDWQPSPEAADPYERIDPLTVRGQSIAVVSTTGLQYGAVSPNIAERWGLPGAVWAPGLVVESTGNAEVILAPSDEAHATWPIEGLHVVVRDELAKRSLQWKQRRLELRRLSVNVSAQVHGLIELRLGQQPRELPVTRAAERQWKAVALALPARVPNEHPAPGWALITTLPLIANANPGALLPWFDQVNDQLLLIEVEPGGVGLVEALYTQMEPWLERAQQLAQACATHSLYAPFASPELQWLQALRLKPEGAQTRPAEATSPVLPMTGHVTPPSVSRLPQPVAHPVATPLPAAVASQPTEVPPNEQPVHANDLEQPSVADIAQAAMPTAQPVHANDLEQPSVAPTAAEATPAEQSRPLAEPLPLPSPRVYRPRMYAVPPPAVPPVIPPVEPGSVRYGIPLGQPVTEALVPEAETEDVAWEPEAASTLADEIEDIAWEPDSVAPTQQALEVPPPLPFPASQRPSSANREPLRRPTPPRYAPERGPRQVDRPLPGPRQPNANPARPSSVPPRTPSTPPNTAQGNAKDHTEERAGDVGGMIARLRHLRTTRDGMAEANDVPTRTMRRPPDEAVEPRFKAGDRVQCVPYGAGRVVESLVSGGREVLRIDFGEDGIIEVDPTVSLVRLADQRPPATSIAEE